MIQTEVNFINDAASKLQLFFYYDFDFEKTPLFLIIAILERLLRLESIVEKLEENISR